ncbi:MAG: TlpA family protein disulfide reductase, partial [Chloroflexota bacterium]|nr:TlpA family protein disulfide reductase [Chloroflexota bacterium]
MLAGVLWLLIQRDNGAGTSSAILNQPAPEFRVRTLDDEAVPFSDLKGQPVWLSFWAVWCGPCRKEMPAVAEVGREAEANGIRLLALNTGESQKTVRDFLRKNPYPGLPVVLDENGSTGSAYQVYNLPTHVFIDADGIVREVKLGRMDADEMRAAIEEIR